MIRSKKLALWLAATLAAAVGMVTGVATPAFATNACPLYHTYYSANNVNPSYTDSYGTWANPDIGYETKQGNTTCGGNVYISNLVGPSSHSVLVRVWYFEGSVAHSHTPVLVPMSSTSPGSSTLYNLGPVATNDPYIIQVLSRSSGPTTGAGCLNVLSGGILTPCFSNSRG